MILLSGDRDVKCNDEVLVQVFIYRNGGLRFSTQLQPVLDMVLCRLHIGLCSG